MSKISTTSSPRPTTGPSVSSPTTTETSRSNSAFDPAGELPLHLVTGEDNQRGSNHTRDAIEEWQQMVEDEDMVREWQASAEAGDAGAM